MSKSVFWSWQSDRDARVTRNLIREAMVIALDRLNSASELEERVDIDHDTKGIAGSPDIVASILDKIDAAEMFVADITPIAVSDSGKHIANPNVLIELGYAKKSLGPLKWVSVWNTAFTDCKIDDLPFDLRGKRGPITYRLPEGASKEEMREARTLLAAQFEQAIGACLQEASARPPVKLPWKPSVANDPSTWIASGEAIRVNEYPGSGVKSLADGGRWYVRLLPRKFDPAQLDNGAYAPPAHLGSHSWGRTTGGTMTYSGSVRGSAANDPLHGASMWFRDTGEIWSTHLDQRGTYEGLSYSNGDRTVEHWVQALWYGLNKLASNGGAGPFRVKLGVTGLDGTHWNDVYSGLQTPPVALEDQFETEFETPSFAIADWKDRFVDAWTEYRRCFSMPPAQPEKIAEIFAKCR